ncbi:DUF7281 domain-containing protein [Ruegeria sp.]|uniref:DUF7281 domain-containing protein n=1 Tax=Ruegeria sp. TaxID=1879320 RepID=UPI003AFF6A46
MSQNLIKAGLRALSEPGSIRASKELLSYLRDNNIFVTHSGSNILMGTQAREELVRALERDFQVPPGTKVDAWKGKSRAEALSLGSNEKASSISVRRGRVALKSFSGGSIRMGEKNVILPDGVNLDVPVNAAADFSDHVFAVLVENWEAFEHIHQLSFEVPADLRDALVVYRGQPGGYTIDAARTFLRVLSNPVFVFPDVDPAGLRIALETPGFAGVMLPPIEEIESLLCAGRGLSERYTSQLAGSERVLEGEVPTDVKAYWSLIKKFGRGVPQEEFIRF